MVARVLLPLAFVLALFGTASAEKVKVAVLGLEVAGSSVDRESTTHGRTLTDAFRGRVGTSAKFMIAPNSIKDLLDEKVANNCGTEAADCMAKIGGNLKAQILIFGKVEKRPKDKLEGYQLSMKALDVDKKTFREWGDWIPLSDFADNKLDARVARGFDVLTKDDSSVVSVPTGPTGPTGPTPPKKGGGGFPWKVTAYAATGVSLVLLGGLVHSNIQMQKTKDNCPANTTGDGDQPDTYRDAMGNPRGDLGEGYDPIRCSKDGYKFSKRTWITGLSAAAVGGFALFAYYEGFIAKKERPNQGVGQRTRKKKQFAVTPIVSPDGAGATVRLDW